MTRGDGAPSLDEDRELVERFLRHRDEAAFRALYRRHTPALYGLIMRLLGGSRPVAQDLVQETWMRASRGLSGFLWRSALRSWLCGIAVNLVRDHFRAQGDPMEPLPVVAARPDAIAERIDLDRALALLPPGYRQVLVLREIEGYTHEEVGRLLGIDPGTSKSQLFHARRALRTLLGDTPIT